MVELRKIPNSIFENTFIPLLRCYGRDLKKHDMGRTIVALIMSLEKRTANHIIDKKALDNVIVKWDKIQAKIMADPVKYPDLISLLD